MNKIMWIIAVLIAASVGFWMRGMLPSGKAEAGRPAGRSMPPPSVRVMTTQLENASLAKAYIARVEPIQEVRITAQVEGMIQEVHFQEGARVERGDLLFTIDPAPYEATLTQRTAELEQASATLNRAEKYLEMLRAAENRSVSKSDLDTAEANAAEGRARVKIAEATVQQAKIDVGFTQITSPIQGRIGQALITRGNVVSPASGALATVIQVDPIRVVFGMPDAEYLTAFDHYSNNPGYKPDIRVKLANGMTLEDPGEIEFDDNQMNPKTGTIDIRLRFPNPRRLLVANNFVTILVSEADTPQKILVPSEAVVHDTDGAYVWTVDADNMSSQARVNLGAVIGTQQVIESGLELGVRVVVAGLQNIRPGVAVSIIEK